MEPVLSSRSRTQVEWNRASSPRDEQESGADAASTARAMLTHPLRRLGTGLLFAIFGLGAVVVALIAFPVLAWRSHGVARELAAQRLISRCCAAFVSFGCALRLLALREIDTHRLVDSPGLVVATHPTLLDVVFLLSRMPQADCIVKAEAWRNPFLRHMVTIAGYVPNRDGPSVIAACVERLRAGRSIIVFPEGTRSPAEGLRPFRRGFAHIALQSGCLVTPVRISCTPPALKRGQPWWDVPDTRLLFMLDVGTSFRVDALQGVDPAASRAHAARAISTEVHRRFEVKDLHVADA